MTMSDERLTELAQRLADRTAELRAATSAEQKIRSRVTGHYCNATTSLDSAIAIARSLQMCGDNVDGRSISDIAGVLHAVLGSCQDNLLAIYKICSKGDS